MQTLQAIAFGLLFVVGPATVWAAPCPTLQCPDGGVVHADGKIWQCKLDGKPHGPTVQCYDGRIVTRIEYRAGEKHGVEEHFDHQGRHVRREHYVDGKGQGFFERWYPGTDQKQDEAMVANDQYHGVTRRFHRNGRIAAKGMRVRGKAQGAWTEWREDGSLATQWIYVDDQRSGPAQWYHPDGSVHTETSFLADKPHGPYIERDAQGTVLNAGTYDDGKRVGPWSETLGGIVAKGKYVDGVRDGEWTYAEAASGVRELKTFSANAVDATWSALPHPHDVLHGPFSRWEGERVVATGQYMNALKHGDWRTFERGVEMTKEVYEQGLLLEKCSRRKPRNGSKLRCKQLVGARMFGTQRCSLRETQVPARVIRTQAEFDAVYDCGDHPIDLDWSKFMLWVRHTRGIQGLVRFSGAQRDREGLLLQFVENVGCFGAEPPDAELRMEIVLQASDDRVRDKTTIAPTPPDCYGRP